MADDEDASQPRSAGRRKLPVRIELFGVNRYVVSVAFDADIVWSGAQSLGNLAECCDRRWLRARCAALIKSRFAQRNNQAFASNPQCNNVLGDLVREKAFKIPLDALKVLLHLRR